MKKKIIISTVIVLIATMGFAQKVALHSASGVQHFTGTNPFQAAYTAAESGDTIYLPGGSFAPPANFNKTLTIFGTGHYPDSTEVTGKTFINGGVTLVTGADNFYIEGVEITGAFTFDNNHSVNWVTVKRCRINGVLNVNGNLATPSSNLAVIGCVLNGASLPNAQNAAFFNSIFSGEASNISSSTGNIYKNNIFMQNNYPPTTYATTLNGGGNNLIENNIFLRNRDYEIGGSGNTIKNNIFPKTAPVLGTQPISSGNFTGIELADLFVNQIGNAFSYAHDYHLQEPETYLGTDGTQVGIYGGIFPWKEGAVPSNPHIQSAIVAPTTNEGKLNVQIKAISQ
jgi:hypothetical protein